MHVYSVNWIYAKGSTSQSRNVMTFTTNVGLRRYKRLSFGINSAAEIFQNAIQNALEGLEGVRNISDDIIVFGCNWQEHDQRLKATFKRLQEKHLTVNNMRGSRNFVRGGGGGPGPTARKQPGRLFVCVFSVLNLFYSLHRGSNGFITEKTVLFQGSRGGPTFSRGGGGSKCFYRNPYNL